MPIGANRLIGGVKDRPVIMTIATIGVSKYHRFFLTDAGLAATADVKITAKTAAEMVDKDPIRANAIPNKVKQMAAVKRIGAEGDLIIASSWNGINRARVAVVLKEEPVGVKFKFP